MMTIIGLTMPVSNFFVKNQKQKIIGEETVQNPLRNNPESKSVPPFIVHNVESL